MRHTLHYKQYLDTKLPIAWAFFSSPKNLALISPPDVTFEILTPLKDELIYEGQLIDYRVSPFLKIPLHWQTEITVCEPNHQFVDLQREGPYKFWSHRHTFIEKDDGVEMEDFLEYELPLGPVGEAVNYLVVRKKLIAIFDYRKQICDYLFNE